MVELETKWKKYLKGSDQSTIFWFFFNYLSYLEKCFTQNRIQIK